MELQKEQIPAKSHTPESSVRNNRHPGEDGGSDDGAAGSSIVPFAVPGIDGQPSQFGCPAPGCMLSFPTYPLCDAHFQSHDLKQFVCTHPGCGKSFKRNHDMKRHAKQHEGLKAYKCDKCGKEFGRSDALRRHERKIDCESEDGSYRLKRRKREDGTEGDMDGGGDADMGSEGLSQDE
jgi:DNA-directed RNA polymerase subunit RPC12/RpoP